MLQNFLRIAFRNLTKRKGYSILNILGLTIGIVCCLLIFEYVAYERSYDAFHEKAGRIYRVQDENYQNGKLSVLCASNSPAVAPTMIKEFPEVENACRLIHDEYLLANDARHIVFNETKLYWADASVLDMFHIPLVAGDPHTALSSPDRVIISTSTAKKYFGSEDPIGKTLMVRGSYLTKPVQVTGVFADYPANSHLVFNILISYPTLSKVMGFYGKPNDLTQTAWNWTDYYTYILLRPGADVKQVAAKLPAFVDRHFNDLPENKASHDRYTYSLMPLKDIHLYSHYTEEAEPNGDGQSVSFLFLIAFFIAGIAWINYINLATARSLERAREVGVRKVLGALRTDLIRQFMVESFLLNLFALLLALLVTACLNPVFVGLTGRPISSIFTLPFAYWQGFAVLFLGGTLLSGIYPALVLSRYHPVSVLKGLFKNTAGGQLLRKGLIVGQFAASIILIAGTVIVYRQVYFMRHQTLGVNIDRTIVVNGNTTIKDSLYWDRFQTFRRELLQVPGVKGVTASSFVMGQEILWSTNYHIMGRPDPGVVQLFQCGVDYNFIPDYGIKIVAGRPFSQAYTTDNKAVLLNASAVKALGFTSPAEAVGSMVKGDGIHLDSLHVIGVVADYHQEGLQRAIQPLVFLPRPRNRSNYSIKVAETDMSRLIGPMKQVWNRYFPDDPFNYFFLDEFFSRQYAENQRFGEIFGLFAILAIVIACFGLLGLSAYNVLQRTKEIGIRKVLGASTRSLLVILSRDFLFLVGIAFVFAIPVTWWAMNSWLQGFAYRIGISWWVFALSGSLAIGIALLTVGAQALKAALANPIDSLRTE